MESGLREHGQGNGFWRTNNMNRTWRCVMRQRVLTWAAVAAATPLLLSLTVAGQSGAAPLKTPWGDPDLQGIWTNEFETPLQRSAKYANREFFSDAEVAEFDRARAAIQRR